MQLRRTGCDFKFACLALLERLGVGDGPAAGANRSPDRRVRRATVMAGAGGGPGLDVRNPPDGRPRVWHLGCVDIDAQRCWQAVEAGDPRFDGWFYCAVTSTGIYCRPSCPARTPKRANVRFFATAAAAQAAGFRACKRCRPDAAPGSPEWDRRGDLVGRAMRLIADGVVDREGVGGLASRLGYTARHVTRELVAVAGAGPLALARAQRAQTARILLETTDVSITEVAFASGFHSVRQFNATVQEVFATAPGKLRALAQRHGLPPGSGPVVLRLPYRAPLDARGLIDFLARRAVPGVEEIVDGAYRRSLRLPQGAGTVELSPGDGHVLARYWLDDLGDLAAAIQRCRALLDLDSDPTTVTEALGRDALIGAVGDRGAGAAGARHRRRPRAGRACRSRPAGHPRLGGHARRPAGRRLRRAADPPIGPGDEPVSKLGRSGRRRPQGDWPCPRGGGVA